MAKSTVITYELNERQAKLADSVKEALSVKDNVINISEAAAIKAIATATDVDENDVSLTIAAVGDWFVGVHATATQKAIDMFSESEDIAEVKVNHSVGDFSYKDTVTRKVTKSKPETFGSPNRIEYTQYADHRPRIDYKHKTLSSNIDATIAQAEKLLAD